MRRFLALAILTLTLSGIGFAQAAATPQSPNAPARKPPTAEYAGSWIVMFEGHAWLTIRLTQQGSQLTGTVQHPHDFQLSDNGELKSVSEEQVTEVVQSAAVQGDGLLLTVKTPEAQETNRFLMRLTGPAAAEVRMVAMSVRPGMAKPQPWKVSKVTANTATAVPVR